MSNAKYVRVDSWTLISHWVHLKHAIFFSICNNVVCNFCFIFIFFKVVLNTSQILVDDILPKAELGKFRKGDCVEIKEELKQLT